MEEIKTIKTKTFLNKKTKRTLFYCAIVALPVLQFCIFYLGVNFNSILLAFKTITKAMASDGSIYYAEEITGLDTFKLVFQDLFSEDMGQVWRNTFVSYGLGLLLSTPLGLLFSYYIFKKFFGSNVFKVLLFLPQVVSGLVLIVMYKYFVADVLPTIFPSMPDVLDPSRNSAFYALWVFGWWMGFGSSVLMYVGGMNNISESILEYAKLDGVNAWQEFIHIIMPMIYPTFTTFFVVGIASIFTNQMRLFDFYGNSAELYLQTLGYHMYAGLQRSGTDLTKYPYFAAMGVFFTFVTVPVTLFVRWAMQKFGPRVD